MTKDDAQIGARIKTLTAWSGVPIGTEGVIDEHYQHLREISYMIAWDLPRQPLPIGYQEYDGRPAFISGILRDGFSASELIHLTLV